MTLSRVADRIQEHLLSSALNRFTLCAQIRRTALRLNPVSWPMLSKLRSSKSNTV
jgi:hypothetical protein